MTVIGAAIAAPPITAKAATAAAVIEFFITISLFNHEHAPCPAEKPASSGPKCNPKAQVTEKTSDLPPEAPLTLIKPIAQWIPIE
ncbi:hypothetical protein ACFSZS_19280 [Seohaeicola zhoushanensis]